jgi:hypothetical protein
MGCLVAGNDRRRDAPALADLDALLLRPLPHIRGVSTVRCGTSARPSASGFQDIYRPGAGADRAHPDCTQRAEVALAKLIDQAVGLGVGWPEIAARLG